MAEEVGLGDQLRFTPGRRRLLRRRRDARLQRRRRPAALLAAEPAGAPAPGLVRRPVPAAQLLRQARARSRSRPGCGGICGNAGLASGSGSRCSTRASTATPRGCPPPTSGPAPGACPAPARKGSGGEEMGHIVGGHQRLIDAMVARRARARRRDAHRRAGRAAWRLAEDGSVTGVELERRDARVRPDDPDPAAAGPALPAARAPPGPARRPIPSAGSAASARSSRCGARCCPTTRSTSSSRRR